MSIYRDVLDQLNQIQRNLIQEGVVNEFRPLTTYENRSISFENELGWMAEIRHLNYSDTYEYLRNKRLYFISMPDEALIQIQYCFEEGDMTKHRLLYMPSPRLQSFQDDPELYEDDVLFADVIFKGVLPVPIRFDYDPANAQTLIHPAAHATFGQLQNCRIPVSMPLSPRVFFDFILRSFYPTWYSQHTNCLPRDDIRMDDSIAESERRVLHFSIQQSHSA